MLLAVPKAFALNAINFVLIILFIALNADLEASAHMIERFTPLLLSSSLTYKIENKIKRNK